jgi:hypothetical protein
MCSEKILGTVFDPPTWRSNVAIEARFLGIAITVLGRAQNWLSDACDVAGLSDGAVASLGARECILRRVAQIAYGRMSGVAPRADMAKSRSRSGGVVDWLDAVKPSDVLHYSAASMREATLGGAA